LEQWTYHLAVGREILWGSVVDFGVKEKGIGREKRLNLGKTLETPHPFFTHKI